MIFEKLFTPKWKHKNPNVRKHALLSLRSKTAESQSILSTVAVTDEESSIRRIAVQRLIDLDLLSTIITNDKDPKECSDAQQRLCLLLAGNSDVGLSYEQRITKISMINDEDILNFLVKEAKEAQIRLDIAKRLDQQSLYGEMAISDGDRDVRLAALKCVNQRAILERIVKQARRKDKAISQSAQSQLDAMRQGEENLLQLRQEAKLLCAEMNNLVNTARENAAWDDSQIEFDRIMSNWQQLDYQWQFYNDDVDKSYRIKFEQNKNAYLDEKQDFQEGLARRHALNEKYAPIQKDKSAVCDQLEQALAELKQTTAPSLADFELLKNLLDDTKQRWAHISHTLDSSLEQYDAALDRSLNERFTNITQLLDTYRTDITLFLRSAKQAEALAAKIEHYTNKAKFLTRQELDKFTEQWQQLQKPRYFKLANTETVNIDGLLTALNKKFTHQESQRVKDKQQFERIVKQLDAALSSGQVAQANKLMNQGRKIIRQFAGPDLHEFRDNGVLQKFQNLQDQVNELQDWRKWSNEPKKVKLCQTMEQLAQEIEDKNDDSGLDYVEIAEQVRIAREQWKQLSKAEVNSSPELWQKFDEACTKAYAPCQEYYAQESQKRDNNLQQRATICSDLENYIEHVDKQDSSEVDWKAVNKILTVAKQEWHQLGEVNRKDKPTIDQRFKAAVNKLEKLNREEKDRNRDKKLFVIKSAENLVSSLHAERISLSEAIESVKRLQADWKNIGLAAKDGELWRQFRNPCDEIFGVRQSNIEQEQQNKQQILEARNEVCQKIEQFALISGDELLRARAEVEALTKQWAEFEDNNIKNPLEKRFRAALRAFEKQLLSHDQQVQQDVKLQQQTLVDICWQLEELIRQKVNTSIKTEVFQTQVETIKQHWNAIDKYRDQISKAIQQRFDDDMDIVEQLIKDDDIALIDTLKQKSASAKQAKLNLCLQLEILANVDSPPQYQQARLEFQVSMLANRMKQSHKDNLASEAQALAASWFVAGIIPNSYYVACRFALSPG